MKKIFLFSTFLAWSWSIPVGAATYTNEVPEEYRNEEYMANGEAFTAVGADKAYNGSEGAYTGLSGKNVTIAIMDSGTWNLHPDLENKIVSEAAGVNRYGSTHGTHTAGIVAAKRNDTGMHGIAYGATLLPFSLLLGGEGACSDSEYCMEWSDAYEILADDTFNSIRIVNNSWQLNGGTDEELEAYAKIAQNLTDKGKLIIASAGNETEMSPASFPAKMPFYNSATARNVISVVAYDPIKTPSDIDFIAGYSNLALGAQKWSLAAPGTIYSTITYTDDDPRYASLDGTSMAAPMVSGAAALVSEAFPYLDGKQIADVLFSTAFKKEDLDAVDETKVSPYMVQNNDAGKIHALYFEDNIQGKTYEEAVALLEAAGYSCSDANVTCSRVVFEDVFGQGLLNIGDAIKGPKYFDANRLTASDYDETLGQFFYTVNVNQTEEVSTWKNNIGEKKSTIDEYLTAGVGLKKEGAGSLSLSGTNTFTGISYVEEGSLIIPETGSLAGGVVVNAGNFALEGGTLNGSLTVNENGTASIAGTLDGDITNKGNMKALDASVSGDVDNTGSFQMSGDFDVSGSFDNKNALEMANMALFHAPLNNEGTISVSGTNVMNGAITNASSGIITLNSGSTLQLAETMENNGRLVGNGTIVGAVNNNATGSIPTSINVGDLTSSGVIMLAKGSGDEAISAMQVDTLNITGGNVTLLDDSVVYENGKTYTIINFNTLTAFDNFEAQTRLTDFITANTSQDGNKIVTAMEYSRISESDRVTSLSADERQLIEIVDKMFIDEKKSDFGYYYNYSSSELKKRINALRAKAQPVQRESLPLTKVMTSQVQARLFSNTMNRDASSGRTPFIPMQQYQGKYYRGRSGGNEQNKNKVWGQILGGRVHEDADKQFQQGKSNTSSVGAMFGYDQELSEHLLVGWTAGAARAELKQNKDIINVNDYRAGIYTGSRYGRITVNTMLMGGIQKYQTKRALFLGGGYKTSKGNFNGYSAEFDINLGYDITRMPYRDYSFYLRSYLGANVNHIHQDAYKENASSFLALGVDEADNTSVSVSPGLTLGYTLSRSVITLDAGYQRVLNGNSLKNSAYFLTDAAKTRFSSTPSKTDKDFINAGLGIKTNLTRRLQFNLWGGIRKSKNSEALNFSALMAYSF